MDLYSLIHARSEGRAVVHMTREDLTDLLAYCESEGLIQAARDARQWIAHLDSGEGQHDHVDRSAWAIDFHVPAYRRVRA